MDAIERVEAVEAELDTFIVRRSRQLDWAAGIAAGYTDRWHEERGRFNGEL